MIGGEKSIIEVCGFPPSRQKKGAKMGHGISFSNP